MADLLPAGTPNPTGLQDVFAFDLTLAEIKTLRAKQRVDIRCVSTSLRLPPCVPA